MTTELFLLFVAVVIYGVFCGWVNIKAGNLFLKLLSIFGIYFSIFTLGFLLAKSIFEL